MSKNFNSKKHSTENSKDPKLAPIDKAEPKLINEDSIPDLDDFSILLNTIVDEQEITKLNNLFSKHLSQIIKRHAISQEYFIIFLYENHKSITEDMADKIYEAVSVNEDKPILLILNSKGGRIEPAYLISKTCKENSPKFVVSVPRRAKSAATLISLGANEIHMGSMSELGPIDPQFGGLPALGLTSSLESLAKVVTKYPKSSEMFASFLSEKLDLSILGYFERVSESAMQYAIRLLSGKYYPKKIEEIAQNFVYEYKDHSFVVDKEEASKFLGDTIKVNTPEYILANDIHQFMGNVNMIAGILRKKNVGIIGSFKGLTFSKIEDD